MPVEIFERFANRATMLDAEHELILQGTEAIPLLESLLDGAAKNEFGVPYRQLGLPLRCAVETASRLGPLAKPLEGLLVRELEDNYFPAAVALGMLGTLEDSSVAVLARFLDSEDLNLSSESAVALSRCGCIDRPEVRAATAMSVRAAENLRRFGRNL